MTLRLDPGTYYAGINRPFFISQDLVRGKIEDLGGSNVAFHPRSEPLPASVNPMSFAGYDDGWDEWVSVDYTGPSKDVDVSRHWSWLLGFPTHAASAPAPQPSASPNAPATSPAPGVDPFLIDTRKTSLVPLFLLGALFVAGSFVLGSSKRG